MMEHPTFGRVPKVVTLFDLPAGTELSIHYMLDMAAATDHIKWYV
jgi:hypothetical protein